MQWQDIALSLGTMTFIVALLPSIFSKDKPAVTTSVMTGCVLVIFTIVYISLSLWFSVVTTSITAVLWFVLAFQKLLLRKK